ncbi:MAG: hypothetical protein M1830_004534 [Pleopsidium flavum]|nr:MAG: hypothetical protein M1830_004534 [Pleopsidium flavum]
MSAVHAPSLPTSKITKAELDSLQIRYDELIEGLTAQEDAKVQRRGREPGELLSLDRTRFDTIPQGLAKRKEEGADKVFLEKEEVEELVRWKLYVYSVFQALCFLHYGTYILPVNHVVGCELMAFLYPREHGTFRPRLTQLVASNSEEDIQRTTREAFKTYASNPDDYAVSIKKLATLKGIGPATASLLLSVYDPENVPFFSDEVFRWICWDEKSGWGRKIKYDVKEYKELFEGVKAVRTRLTGDGGEGEGEGEGVGAADLEKGAFVLGREALTGMDVGGKRKSEEVSGSPGNAVPSGSIVKNRVSKPQTAIKSEDEKQDEDKDNHFYGLGADETVESGMDEGGTMTHKSHLNTVDAKESTALTAKRKRSKPDRVRNSSQVEQRKSKRSKLS